MIRKTLAGAAVFAALVGAYATHGKVSAAEPIRHTAVSCVQKTDHDGNASLGHCADAPRWTVRPCATAHSVDCRQDAARHPYIVREFPGSAHMVCVMYVDRSYAVRNDYCEATR